MEKDEWSKTHLFDKQAKPPFSFVYGGQPSEKLLADWPRKVETSKIDAARTQHTIRWTDPKTGLEVRCVAVDYADYPALEWTVYFKHTGTNNTPVLENIRGLDTEFFHTGTNEFRLHGNRGDVCGRESYTPWSESLPPKAAKRYAPNGGRSTNGAFPYFNLQMPGTGGVIMAIGWPGQWTASFTRDGQQKVRVTGGQELTRLSLRPGESVRSPLIALVFWQGDDVVSAQNLWRRWMVAHNLPKVDGTPPAPQLNACSSHQTHECFNGTEANQKQFIDQYAAKGIKLDYWWCDLGWFNINSDPAEDGKPFNGLYDAHPVRFPNGLRPVSDHARSKGLKQIAWFEPEHFYSGAGHWVSDNHPDWQLKPPAGSEGQRNQGAPVRTRVLLDMGNPAALEWVINLHDKRIKEHGIDMYRLDFNVEPIAFWRANDAPDRQGMTENRYVSGFLAFYDALLQRNPGLRIDNCASGGRRNDLETMRRAVPLLRSDALFEPISQQGHTHGLASWLPVFGTGMPAGAFDAWIFRSMMGPSIILCYDVRKENPEGFKRAAEFCSQWRAIAGTMLGDYYPLTPHSVSAQDWLAWQFNRLENGDGIVQAFRRPQSPVASLVCRLRGLDPSADYEVTNIDVDGTTKVSGKELTEQGLTIEIKDKPGAAVIVYRRLTQRRSK